MKLYDITRELSAGIAVFPGDVAFSSQWCNQISKGDSLNLSAFTCTSHAGTHIDAPLHYQGDGKSIDQYDLNYFIGKAQVIKVDVNKAEAITPAHLNKKEIVAERILFCTNTFDYKQWTDNYAAFSPELILYLSEKGVKLIGIDTPGVDLFTANDAPIHHLLNEKEIASIEGLYLTEVPEGIYELIALPLKLVGLEASPVRAVLRTY